MLVYKGYSKRQGTRTFQIQLKALEGIFLLFKSGKVKRGELV